MQNCRVQEEVFAFTFPYFALNFTIPVNLISGIIMIAIAIMLGLRNELLVPVMILFGAPTAVSSFPMAQQMGADSDLAASLVVFTTAFSILTIFVWVFVLKQMCFI